MAHSVFTQFDSGGGVNLILGLEVSMTYMKIAYDAYVLTHTQVRSKMPIASPIPQQIEVYIPKQ